ncbi:glucokinase [Diaminobutyricimonas aerilata]|uniref:Glucokinase n=1 Tax=Diaminobutyricimonas aerilata TaxID=1162967 RepID=A0A2M9CHA1_9MICO|nr:ROK family protein [Diaminobutyricimonas aerilata]PJJ71293.1 glucokinase [Diaminobutyricimonas aerilata]
MADSPRPVLALDIGGTKLAVAVVSADGRTHGLTVEPTRKEEGPDAVLRRLFDMGHRAMVTAGLGAISAVGISCGGPLDARAGVLISPLHLPGWVNVPIVELAQREFGVPAVLENDATAAVLGEHRYGAARGADIALYLTVSTGVGGGAIVNGRLHRGAAGNGGEFGHIVVRHGGRPCLCGRNGCLETYASGTSIAARATEAVAAATQPSMLAALPVIRGEDVSSTALAGDPVATEVWDETVATLVDAITDLVNVFEPNVVVLGGGVTRSGAQLLDPVRAGVLRDAMAPAGAAARVELAGLGDEVCVVGAAALAFDRVQEDARV